MSDFGRRFDASELDDDVVDDAAAAELLATARDLEAYSRSDSVTVSVDFEDRVMVAIAKEPPPRPVGSRGLLGIVSVVRDAWRLAWSADRPLAVRAQALAFVLLAAVALGSLGSLAAVGVGAMLSPDEPVPTVQPAPVPTPSPSVLPSPSPSISPSPSATPSASPTETVEPTETAGQTDDSSGPGSGGDTPGPGQTDDSSGPGSGDDRTPRPTDDSSGTGSGGDSSGPGSGSDSSGSGSGG